LDDQSMMETDNLVENIAYACLTKQCEGNAQREAVHWINPDFSSKSYSFKDLEAESNKIAAVIHRLGVQPGDVVSIFLPRSPELTCALFAILKNQAISNILFSTLGPEALFDRLDNSRSKIIFTKKSLLRKITAIREKLGDLKYIILVDEDNPADSSVVNLPTLIADVASEFTYAHFVSAETPAFLQYTSGSTGKPKAALHVHGALADIVGSFHEILQVNGDEIYWCTADPAWITGLVYGILAPMCTGTRQIQFSGSYKAKSWMRVLDEQQINVWYTAPTALRGLMQEEISFQEYFLGNLRRVYSVGEPLNPEIISWVRENFYTEIFDTWFQSETGSIMIANRPGVKVKPGSMGVPRSKVEIQICDDQAGVLPVGAHGHLCVRAGWGSMFRTYYHRQDDYTEKFRGGIYFTGDLAWIDDDGYVWYISRSDDVINSAGHLVGPFEIESALLEIEEIIDVAVIGVPDPYLHEKIVAFISLRKGVEWSRELELKCRIYVANQVSTVATPAEFILHDHIPKNQSGKILRRVLKAVYQGNNPGDLSTMEQL
jgi:acetyl-CoA synthetase